MNYKSKSCMQYGTQNVWMLKGGIGGFHYCKVFKDNSSWTHQQHDFTAAQSQINIEYSVRQEASPFQNTFKSIRVILQKIMWNHTTQKVVNDQ